VAAGRLLPDVHGAAGQVAGRGAHGRTEYDPPQWLELEAHSGPLGTARIAFDIRAWGGGTLVILDEHPLRDMGAVLHNPILDVLLQLRHRSMLGCLARLVESLPDEAPVRA
jgi:hypothetical protein